MCSEHCPPPGDRHCVKAKKKEMIKWSLYTLTTDWTVCIVFCRVLKYYMRWWANTIYGQTSVQEYIHIQVILINTKKDISAISHQVSSFSKWLKVPAMYRSGLGLKNKPAEPVRVVQHSCSALPWNYIIKRWLIYILTHSPCKINWTWQIAEAFFYSLITVTTSW